MKKLLNTLYITSPDRYLSLDGENVVVLEKDTVLARFPLHNFEAIVTMGYTGASPALMGKCAEEGIDLCFLSRNGRFKARVSGENRGNVLLRKTQYRMSDDAIASMNVAKSFLIGKIYNARYVLLRTARDYPLRVDAEKFKNVSDKLKMSLIRLDDCMTTAEMRGVEGEAAKWYFSVFDDMILQQKEDFYFHERNRRPPLDNMNAMMSFIYTLLAGNCASALEAVGLDPYVGFLHTDRPGRASLALDLMEELRPVLADRFVISLVNKRIVSNDSFIKRENGAVMMTDEAKKIILNSWQSKKAEELKHPFLDDKIEWETVPYVQSLLLARFIRGDIDAYPPFLWK